MPTENTSHITYKFTVCLLPQILIYSALLKHLCLVYQKCWNGCVACRLLEYSCPCWQPQPSIFSAVISEFTCNNHQQCVCTDVSSSPLVVWRQTNCGKDGNVKRRNVLSLLNKASHIQTWEDIQHKKFRGFIRMCFSLFTFYIYLSIFPRYII